MRICVVGAGCSGILALKSLKDEGFFNVTCFEASGDIGGVWTQRNYECLTLNSSRLMAQLGDFDWPFDTSDFPNHTEFVRYYRKYVEANELQITFNSRVIGVTLDVGDVWVVQLQSGDVYHFDAVLVCSGPFSTPNIPPQLRHLGIHASAYRNPKPYAGKNVCLVGIGNTALDVALDLAEGGANSVTIATSSGALLIPCFNETRGEPADYYIHSKEFSSKPGRTKAQLLYGQSSELVDLCIGKGMPNPMEKSKKPRLSMVKNATRFAKCVETGKISFLSSIPDSSDKFDDVLLCTGYRIDVPFLEAKYTPYLGEGDFFDRGHSGYDTDYLGLYNTIMYPGEPATLFFIGFLDTLANLPTLAQIQCRWVASVLAGNVDLPAEHRRWELVATQAAKDKRRNDKVPLMRSWPREPMHLLREIGQCKFEEVLKDWPDDVPVTPRIFAKDITTGAAKQLAQNLRIKAKL